MDLRPKLARAFAEAAFDAFDSACIIGTDCSVPPSKAQIRKALEKATEAILEDFVSRSLPLPEDEWVSTRDEASCKAFLTKYPRLQELIDLAKIEAKTRWPEARFSFELWSDPEVCHVCREGQRLVMEIHTKVTTPDLAESPQTAWMDWTCGDGPWQDKLAQIGPEANLLSTDVQWTWSRA